MLRRSGKEFSSALFRLIRSPFSSETCLSLLSSSLGWSFWWSSSEGSVGAVGGCLRSGGGRGGLAFSLVLRNEGSWSGDVGEMWGLSSLSEIPRLWVMAWSFLLRAAFCADRRSIFFPSFSIVFECWCSI